MQLKFLSQNLMHLEYESQNLVLEKNRIRFTDKKYECIRNFDKNSVGGGKWKVGDVCPIISSGVDKSSQHRQKKTFKYPNAKLATFVHLFPVGWTKLANIVREKHLNFLC